MTVLARSYLIREANLCLLLRLPLPRRPKRLLLLPRNRSFPTEITLTQAKRTGHIANRQSSITTGMTLAQVPVILDYHLGSEIGV